MTCQLIKDSLGIICTSKQNNYEMEQFELSLLFVDFLLVKNAYCMMFGIK